MSDEELIARLRVDEPMCEEHFTANAAADRIEEHSRAFANLQREYDKRGDRIEALVKERDKYRDAFNTNCLVLRGTEERVERLEAALREILEKPRNADLTYAELFAEVVSEARAALKSQSDEFAKQKGADHV